MKKLVQRRWGRWHKWRTWKIIKMARRTTMKPRRLVHSLGDARPLPRPGFKVVLCTFFFSAEQKRKICFYIFWLKSFGPWQASALEGGTDKTNPIKARTESSTSCFQFLVSIDCVSNARWKTWRAICVGEAEVWFWCGFAPRCCQLRDWVEVAARGGTAVGEGWTGRGWFFRAGWASR